MHRQIRSKRLITGQLFESLEPRQLLTTVVPVTLNSSDPVSDSAFQANGDFSDYNGAVSYVPTDPSSVGSVLSNTKVPIGRFNASLLLAGFPERVDSDFKDFVIEGTSDTAQGNVAVASAGYAGGTFSTKSIAVVIDATTASNLKVGFGIGGQAPTSYVSTGIDDSGNSNANGYIPVTIRYADNKLRVNITDGTNDFSTYMRVDLPSLIGSQTAYVGFAGSTGAFVGSYDVVNNGFQNFNFTGYNTLDFTTPATAAVATGGTTATLDGGATYTSDADISYQWTTTLKPSGAAAPGIADDTDPSTTVRLKKAGTYHFRLTATDTDGSTTFSNVSLRVAPNGSYITIKPHASHLVVGSLTQFSAKIVDQFGKALSTQPTFVYSIATGAGSIDADTGLYTAPSDIGHLVISASGDDLTGVAGATIVKAS